MWVQYMVIILKVAESYSIGTVFNLKDMVLIIALSQSTFHAHIQVNVSIFSDFIANTF